MKAEAGLKWDMSSEKPFIPENVSTIPVAEQGRRLVFKEISLKLSKIRDGNHVHSHYTCHGL